MTDTTKYDQPKPHPVLDADESVEDYGTVSTFHVEETLRSPIYSSSS